MSSSQSRAESQKAQPSSYRPKHHGQRTLDTFFRPQPSQPATSTSPMASSSSGTNAPKPPQTPTKAMPGTPQTSRIAIVLAPSPGVVMGQYSQYGDLDDEDAPPANLISDLSPQFRRLAAQTETTQSVTLGRPSDMYAHHTDDADELAAPRANPQTRGVQLSPPKKKRGRPKGYRPSLMGTTAKAAAAGVSPATKTAAEGARRRGTEKPEGAYYAGPKKRGRPPKPPALTSREVYDSLQPMFQRFICEWERCPAELHNLETLERHIRAVHLRKLAREGQFFCRWLGCSTKPGEPVKLFKTQEEMEEHIDEKHMSLQRWHAGDGPRVTHQGVVKGKGPEGEKTLPAYLFQDGKQVTPSVVEQKEEDLLSYRERRRKLKNLLELTDKNAPEEEEEELEAVETRA